ncbi:hypothetical protein KXS12_26135 [Priestia filamentosa]|uniref:DUF6141 family protein n=1 Tax=Priestia filamentosa TaxID=1402861 RepID=UPI003F175FE3
MKEQEHVIFREVQRPRQIWVWLVILAIAVFMWYSFIKQVIFGISMGNNPAPNAVLLIFWLIFGIAFPLGLLGFMKLITEVRRDGIYVRFVPFHIQYKPFLFKDIVNYTSIKYNSFTRFGGWGIRINFKGETAYNMGGDQGLELQLSRNKTVVVGSQNPDELVKAIDLTQKV